MAQHPRDPRLWWSVGLVLCAGVGFAQDPVKPGTATQIRLQLEKEGAGKFRTVGVTVIGGQKRLVAQVELVTRFGHMAEMSVCQRLEKVIQPSLPVGFSWRGRLTVGGRLVRECAPTPQAGDPDKDGVPSDRDNCPEVADPLQVDLDLDGVGDVCDNCPTEANRDQRDANLDGGGDACQPSPVFDRCGKPFEPPAGVARELLEQQAAHPAMRGVVHPVLQFSAALMEEERELLARRQVRIGQFVQHNVALAAVPQVRLRSLTELPFVRSAFRLPEACRVGEPASCPGMPYGRWFKPEVRQGPEPRRGLAMAHDTGRRLTVLFGGEGDPNQGLLGDTWEYDGSAWTSRLSKRQPPRRRDHALAYLPMAKATVMFGGLELDTDTGQRVPGEDTWLWDGTQWNTVPSRRAPSGRYGHALAFDAARKVVVLFGGVDGGGRPLADTWVFDGTDWKEMSPAHSPPPRAHHAMTYDRGAERLVLFGGESRRRPLADTWLWDGKDWEQVKPLRSPSARADHAMTSHESGCGALLVGGAGEGQRPSAETWFFSNGEWVEIKVPTATEPRSDHAVAYDARRDRTVLFGGVTSRAQLLAWLRELEPSPLLEVLFHDDVPAVVAEQIFAARSATIVTRAVTIGGRRVNSWQAAVPRSEVTALAREDPVIRAQFVGVGVDHNDGSRAAINVVAANAAPFCGGAGCNGNGIVLAQWESRWASGDANPPPPNPPLPAGNGVHVALTSRITVRDIAPLPAPAAPAGCAGNILCNLCTFSNHGAHVAGTMLGNGTGNAVMIGMAPNATSISYNGPTSVAEQACEYTDSLQTFGARVANLSWNGNGNFNCATQAQYDNFSNGVDQQVTGAPGQLIVVSAGNAQSSRGGACAMPALYTPAACTAVPAGVTPPPAIAAAPSATRFFTVGPGFTQSAKNGLVVGAVNSGAPGTPANLAQMTTFSSWGPTQDGRLKPDVVAAGAELDTRDQVCLCGGGGCPAPPACNPDPQITSTNCNPNTGNCQNINNGYGPLSGTSMAAPAVAGGTALLLQQQGVTGVVASDTPLDSDSLRALLIHTATDLSVHTGAGGAFMTLQGCGGGGAAECWPVPPAVAPGVVQDGPDYVNGYGLVNIQAALQKIISGNPQVTLQPSGCPNNVVFNPMPFNSPLPLGGDPAAVGIAGCSTSSVWDWVGYINVPVGTTQLRVTMAWNDAQTPPPAAGATGTLLVNDVDLIVTPGTGMGGSFTPSGPHNYSWWLDPACPHLQAVPVAVNTWSPATYADKRNTVEQVVVNNPASGQWRIVVQSIGTTGQQPFALMISMPPTLP